MTARIRKFSLIVFTCLYSSATFGQECYSEGYSTVGTGGGS
jgi:hypothetical protein